MQRATMALPLSLLTCAMQLAHSVPATTSDCKAAHMACGTFGIIHSECCPGNDCIQFLGGMLCVPHEDRVQPHGICGHSGKQDSECCHGYECKQLLGGSAMRCVKPDAPCFAENDICGVDGTVVAECCGGTECKQLMGGTDMVCAPKQQLLPASAAAGGSVSAPACLEAMQPCDGTGECCGDAGCWPTADGSLACMMEADAALAARGGAPRLRGARGGAALPFANHSRNASAPGAAVP